MRIMIDLQGDQSSGSRNRGIGRYTEALALAICHQKSKHDIHIILNNAFYETIDPIRALFEPLVSRKNIHVFDVIIPTDDLDESNTERRKTNEAMREAFIGQLNPDILLIASLFEGFTDNSVTSVKTFNNIPTVVVLYDLIPFINRIPYLENPQIESWYLRKIDHLKRADLLLSISESSGQEAIDYLGFAESKVVNISTACDQQFRPIVLSAEDRIALANQYGIKKPFVMYTGGIDYRKNIEGLIRSFAALPISVRTQHQLVIVCSAHEADVKRLNRLAREYGLHSADFIMTGFVSENDLVKLYNACNLFIFPSWHEGFGLPALEAMQCGRPVIASNNSSLPEVVGYPDALFDPRSDESMSSKLLEALTDDDFRNRLAQHGLQQAKKFNWNTIAKNTLSAIEKLEKPTINKLLKEAKRPRLAYLSPLPPERSGISDYSNELLEELTRWYSIDVITNQQNINSAWVKANCDVRTIEWFKANSSQFDRVLYHFGNSEFHEHMFDLLETIPGIVVLHDFFLSGVESYRDAVGLAPNAWKQSLYASHGYKAVYLSENEDYPYEALWTYPASLNVIKNALDIIVHSQNSIKMAQTWYGDNVGKDWSVIPLLRTPPSVNDKSKARSILGFNDDAYIICSFGIMVETKQSYEIIQAFINSSFSTNQNSYLIFVGQEDKSDYGLNIKQIIKNSGIEDRILITGWVDNQQFKQYLQAADVGIQLRTLSRGETSAAVLDCLNYGLATIVNKNGSMADLDNDAVHMLPDNFTITELTDALEHIFTDQRYREMLSNNARQKIKISHSPRHCAALYATAIEKIYDFSQQEFFGLSQKIQSKSIAFDLNNSDHLQRLAANFPSKNTIKQIFVDVSILAITDARTGIQRVVRSILRELLEAPPTGYRIEPVFATLGHTGYSYARTFTCKFMGIKDTGWAIDQEIDYAPGDIFLGLDLHPDIAVQQRPYLTHLKNKGVKIAYIVYDLLPILQSQYFEEVWYGLHSNWLKSIHFSDQLLCISAAVADEAYDWLTVYGETRKLPLAVDWFHLGADIESSVPTKGMPVSSIKVLDIINTRPTFLMVGTIEPRKAHQQVFEAFKQLWKQGIDINLVLVGKRGWLVDDFIEQLEMHKEYSRRLIWLDGISDEYLSNIYQASSCLIAASYGEGFGLPLIEAAQNDLSIIARDILVFREVAGNDALYFADNEEPLSIGNCIKEWLKLYELDQHPKSSNIPWLTWQQSTQQLLAQLLELKPTYKSWKSNETISFWGNDSRFLSQTGRRLGKLIQTNAEAGFLIYGPYQPIKAGTYRLTILGSFSHLTGNEYVDMTFQQGSRQAFKSTLIQHLNQSANAFEAIFVVEQNIVDFELRVYVNSESQLAINQVVIDPVSSIEASVDVANTSALGVLA